MNKGELKRNIDTLIETCGGDKAEAIRKVLGGCTSYELAKKCSVQLAPYFGMTDIQFMLCYKRWKRGLRDLLKEGEDL